MSYDSDPPRLADLSSDSSELRNLFQNGRRDVPTDAQLDRLLTRIGPILGAGAALAGDAVRAGAQQAAQAGSSTFAPLTKLVALVAGAGLVASGAFFATRGDGDTPKQSPSTVQTAPPRSAPVAAPAAPPLAAESAVVADEPEQLQPAQQAAKKPAEPADSVKAEAALLERARATAQSDPKKALALTREHSRRFPRGVLAQEREVIAIEALRRLGQGGDADQRAERFKEAYPGSAHQRALESSPSGR